MWATIAPKGIGVRPKVPQMHRDLGMSKFKSKKQHRSNRQRQLSFFQPVCPFFGGALMSGRRKGRRPLAFRRPLHVIMKSSLARRRWAFLDRRNKHKIERWLRKFAQANGLKVYRVAINWDHLHLAVRFPDRVRYNRFIRSLTGTLPRSVLGFEDPVRSFWDHRPFTRIMDWGRDFRGVCRYIEQNVLEALGLIETKERGRDRYAQWLRQSGAFGRARSTA